MSVPAPKTLASALCRLADDIDALLNWHGTASELSKYTAARLLMRAVTKGMRRLDRMIRAAEGKR